MKKLLVIPIILLFNCLSCQGQSYTSITATLTDSQAQVWANATISATIVAPFGNPNPLTNNGTPPITPVTALADGSGVFTMNLDDNTVVTPKGSTWQFTICPNSTVLICSTSIQVIHGPTMNLSSSFTADLVLIAVSASPTIKRAYTDAEVTGGQGAIYWRTTDNTLRGFNGLIWTPIGGAGGSSGVWSDLLNPLNNMSLNMGNFTTLFNMGSNTNSGAAFDITDSSTNSGSGYLFRVWTGTTSNAKAVAFCDSGTVNCVEYNGSAIFQALGAAQIIATQVKNTGPGIGSLELGSNGSGSVSDANTVKIMGNSNQLFASENGGSLSKILLGGQVNCAGTTAVQNIDVNGNVTCLVISGTVQSANGTNQPTGHIVILPVTLGSGTITVALTNSAIFSGSSTYACYANDITTASNAVAFVHNSASSITINGTGSDIIMALCEGY